MRSRAAKAAAMGGTVLAGVLALSAQPGRAAAAATPAPVAAGAVTGTATRTAAVRAVFVLRTVPAIRGVRLSFDGRTVETGRDGEVSVATISGSHRIAIRPPRTHPAGTIVRFSRWLDGLALARRTITLSPGTNLDQAGFVVSHPVAVRFTDPHGHVVPLSGVSRVTIASSLGRRFTFAPGSPPRALPVNRIVRDQDGLVPLIIRYSAREVVIDGSNVVYGGSQNFSVHRSGVWTIKVLLFPMRLEVHDALFGFGIGDAVRLTLPDGSHKIVKLGPGHAVTLASLPRATYQLVAEGPGFGLTSPSALSKPQVAELLLLSWIDILAAVVFAALFVVGLPMLGGRIVRRPGRLGVPAWRAGRPWRPSTAPPAASVAPPAADATEAATIEIPPVPAGGDTTGIAVEAGAAGDTTEIAAVTTGPARMPNARRTS